MRRLLARRCLGDDLDATDSKSHPLPFDDVDETRDELEDVMDLSNSISEALSREIGTPMDEGELEDELAALIDMEDGDVFICGAECHNQ